MGNPGLTDEVMLNAIEKVAQYGTVYQWSKAEELPRGTCQNQYDRAIQAAQKGHFGLNPIIPGFVVTKHTAFQDEDGNTTRSVVQTKPEMQGDEGIPDGFKVTKMSEYIDRQGNRAGYWRQTKPGELSPEEVADLFKKSLEDWKPARIPKLAVPTGLEKDTLPRTSSPTGTLASLRKDTDLMKPTKS